MWTTNGSSPGTDENGSVMDVDVKQQMMYMQMMIKDMGAVVSGLERKLDTSCHGISSVEQQLLKMNQLQSFARMDKGPSLVELDTMFKKNIQQVFSMQGDQGASVSRGDQDVPNGIAGHQEDKFLYSGSGFMASLMPGCSAPTYSSSQNTPLPLMPEGHAGAAGAGSIADGSLRPELLNELRAQQETLMLFLREFKTKQDAQQNALLTALQSLKLPSLQLPPPPMQQPPLLTNDLFGDRVPSGESVTVMAGVITNNEVDLDFAIEVRQRAPIKPEDGSKPKFQESVETLDAASEANPGGPKRDLRARVSTGFARDEDALAEEVIAEPVEASPRKKSVSPASPQSKISGLFDFDAGDDSDDDVDKHAAKLQLREESSMASVFGNDDDVENPMYVVEDFYWKKGINQKIARTNLFANFTVGVVIFNAIYIGVDSDHNDAQNIYTAEIPFQLCSQFFCVYFTWELMVRYLAFENKIHCIKDGWFKFDAFLVSTMILDTWLLMPLLFIIGGGVTIPTQPLRMLRLFKLTRMARLMKAFPELVTMIKGLVRSLRAISSSMILIGLMVYVWAIMMHMLMKEEHDFNKRYQEDSFLGFDTMLDCIWTLLMAGTLMLDDSGPLMTELLFSGKFHYILAGALFVAYAMLSAMLILQMLIGVLCDVVTRVSAEQRDATAIGLVKQEILADLKEFDGGDGKISREELVAVMHNPHSKHLLQKLNINRAFLMELQKMMFTKPGQQVTIKAILELMIMCRGDNPATVQSMAGGLLSVIQEVKEMKELIMGSIQHLDEDITRSGKTHPGGQLRSSLITQKGSDATFTSEPRSSLITQKGSEATFTSEPRSSLITQKGSDVTFTQSSDFNSL